MRGEHRDVAEVAVALVVVEAVAHDEVVGDVEADVAAADLDLGGIRLPEEGEHLHRRGSAGGEVLQQPAEGEAAAEASGEDVVDAEVVDDEEEAKK